jgi:indole-3-glycerol phosphate synthase
MTNILDKIIAQKLMELENFDSFETLQDRLDDLIQAETLPATKGFAQTIRETEGAAIIAELKKASPSKGVFREDFDVLDVARKYRQGGAHCFSVLTDNRFFQGSYENLILVSSEFDIPCLCKEFIIDERQIAQARISGADAVLLIAAILDNKQLEEFKFLIEDYGMDALIEVHNDVEMEKVLSRDFDFIGINNRDLTTFEVSLDTTSKMISKYKYDLGGRTIISESGITSKKDILILEQIGVKGFLVGESLIVQDDLEEAVKKLIF